MVYHCDTDRHLVQCSLIGDFHRAMFSSNHPLGLLSSVLRRSLDFTLEGHNIQVAASAARAVLMTRIRDPGWSWIHNMLKELAKVSASLRNPLDDDSNF